MKQRIVCRIHLEKIQETIGRKKVRESWLTGDEKQACMYCTREAEYTIEINQEILLI
jgi:hypothetical protein